MRPAYLNMFLLVGATCASISACAVSSEPVPNATAGSDQTAATDERLTVATKTDSELSGSFEKHGQRLHFEVRLFGAGASTLRFSASDSKPLYSAITSSTGYELRIGDKFRSFLPASSVTAPGTRTASPSDFEVSGDFSEARAQLAHTDLALLPELSAALGRSNLSGKQSSPALRVHLLALDLVQQQVLPATTVSPASAGAQPPDDQANVAQTSSALSPDLSKTAYCNSGAAREALGDLSGDPCRDDCFGMCGPNCTPWTSICGDTRVHALCWQHDSAYCKKFFGWFPNPDYPLCELEYGVWSASIWSDSVLDHCDDIVPVPIGMWRSHPDYNVSYGTGTSATVADVQYNVAQFDTGDTRFFDGSGDWAVGSYKAECAANEKLIGVSGTAYGPLIQAHGALCVSTTDSLMRTGWGLSTHSLTGWDDRADTETGDWAATEAITGISQTPGLAVSSIQCSAIQTEIGNNDAGCTALQFTNDANHQLSSDPGDWSVNFVKNQCRPDQYMKGVSSSPSTGEIHAILCCNPVFYPH
jgi:hypothetical protein